MNSIWLPELTPPQLSNEAVSTVLTLIKQEGLTTVSSRSLQQLRETEEPLGEFLDRFGNDLNSQAAEGLWPARMLNMGASLTLLAYKETGYYQTMDEDLFAMTSDLAEFEGIPEAYLTSLFADLRLVSIMDEIPKDPALGSDQDGGFRQVLQLGAGCVRYYVQHAAIAA